ncbi:MAG TPA: hypothetical protein VG711_09225, partial [Phycisphaerales bacterium]|nr:hypothetical protein [Phycisphaerales bacterium]
MSFGLSRGKKMVTEGVGMTLADLPALEEGKFDPRNFFESSAATSGEHESHNVDGGLEIEIGSGKGTFLVQHAPKHPETSYFGIEWAAEFYRYAADRIRRHGLKNVKLLHGDAVEFIKFRVMDA